MPWRLVLFLLFLGVVVAFAGLNAGNATDITFGFHTFEDVPIFISLFVAFFLGALIVLPFTLFRRSKKRDKTPKYRKDENQGQSRPSRKERRLARQAEKDQKSADVVTPLP